MVRLWLPLALLGALSATGCVSQWKEFIGDSQPTSLVPPNTVDPGSKAAAPPPATLASYRPASSEMTWRVETIGRKVLAANPEAGLKPLFMTFLSPEPELFHRGVFQLYISQGLVKQCATDEQLAAVLCQEMGKMVAEREALAAPEARRPERRPPPDVPFGNAGQGAGAFDGVREAELARFGPSRPRAAQMLPPPDPKVLARRYLKQAGYAETELDAVAPLLESARANYNLEKQIKATPVAATWSPGK